MTMFKGLDAKLEKENDTLDKIVSLCTYFPGLLSTQDPDLKSWGTKQWSMVMHVTHSPPSNLNVSQATINSELLQPHKQHARYVLKGWAFTKYFEARISRLLYFFPRS